MGSFSVRHRRRSFLPALNSGCARLQRSVEAGIWDWVTARRLAVRSTRKGSSTSVVRRGGGGRVVTISIAVVLRL
jgi:hypothetical protein